MSLLGVWANARLAVVIASKTMETSVGGKALRSVAIADILQKTLARRQVRKLYRPQAFSKGVPLDAKAPAVVAQYYGCRAGGRDEGHGESGG